MILFCPTLERYPIAIDWGSGRGANLKYLSTPERYTLTDMRVFLKRSLLITFDIYKAKIYTTHVIRATGLIVVAMAG